MKNYKQPKRNYLIDFKIIDGLNLTIDQKKIKRNCQLLYIDMSNCKSKISKRNNIAIATLGFGNNKFLQYEVKHNLNIVELNNINDDYIPNEIKPLIIKAYQVAKIQALKDLI